MALQNELRKNTSLKFVDGVFYQAELSRNSYFEQMYLSLRKKEERLYADEFVRSLPEVPAGHALAKEWRVRKISCTKLITYLRRKRENKSILEVGCGNGWLANRLAEKLLVDVVAMDVNETELLQGAGLFASERLGFIYGDIFSLDLRDIRFDTIVLASSVQYFQNVQTLVDRLLNLLTPGGEIHILDSPFYTSQKALLAAKIRSADHFKSLGYPDMSRYYYHHTTEEIDIFNFRMLENPDSVGSFIKRKIFKITYPVFPWIMIKAN